MTFRKFIRVIVLFFAYWFLISGVIIGIIVATGGFFAVTIALDMFFPQLTLLAFIYLVIMLLVVRLKWRKKQKKWLAFTLILGFTAFSLNMLPLFGVNKAIQSAESQFATIFGADWEDKIPSDLKAKFRTTQFNLWDYFNGIPSVECNVTYDIEYALVNGNDSLRFDVYLPLSGIGPFSAIISIHGGGWTSGNKGMGNLFKLNRYLASQGYVVFDIIYGLAQSDLGELLEIQESIGRTSVNYNNSYTIPQMIENIGNFTHFLANNAETYKVNLSSVYVLGRSAGAHLAGCVALGYNNSPYSSVFNQTITIRGGILYYPPINMTTMLENSLAIASPYTKWVDIQELFDYLLENNASKYADYSPISHVDINSPPILLLHGTKDKLVPIDESRTLQVKMQAAGRPCILIEMPFMGHAYDIFAGNPYSQITYYYLERFLALTSIYNL